MRIKPFTLVIIIVALLSGGCLTLLSQLPQIGQIWSIVFLNVGCGLIATAFISIILDLFWARERARAERDELQPVLQQFQEFTAQLGKLERRIEAFKQLGLNYCLPSRHEALQNFLEHAREMIGTIPYSKSQDATCVECRGTINIVSSSARGLIGYLDTDARQVRVQKEWRKLMVDHPRHFRILLTHPAFAHLRQEAEERSSGAIELEILKTAIYLHCVADMRQEQLRLYRGSPTVFLIQTRRHILLNPYPYGQMAMDTLCLEFESENEDSFVDGFASMHFDHAWKFINQDSMRVDNYPLVSGINNFEDILRAFGECVFLHNPKKLRLTRYQVDELDTFACKRIQEGHGDVRNHPPTPAPFMSYVRSNNLSCCDESGGEGRMDVRCNQQPSQSGEYVPTPSSSEGAEGPASEGATRSC